MTRLPDDEFDTPSGQVCWLWWAAESEEARQRLLEAMTGEAGQPLDAGAARQVLAAAR